MNDVITKKKKKLKILKIIRWFLLVSVVMVFALIIADAVYNPHSGPKTYCSVGVNCTKCQDGEKICHYIDDNNQISEDTIICDCK